MPSQIYYKFTRFKFPNMCMTVFKFLSHIMNNVRIVIPSIYVKIFISINSYQIENPLSFSKLVFCHFKYTNMYYLFVTKNIGIMKEYSIFNCCLTIFFDYKNNFERGVYHYDS